MKGSCFFKLINTNGFKSSCEALVCGSLTSTSWSHEGGKSPHLPPHLVQGGCHDKAAAALISESRSLPYVHVQRTGSVQAGGQTSDSLQRPRSTRGTGLGRKWSGGFLAGSTWSKEGGGALSTPEGAHRHGPAGLFSLWIDRERSWKPKALSMRSWVQILVTLLNGLEVGGIFKLWCL